MKTYYPETYGKNKIENMSPEEIGKDLAKKSIEAFNLKLKGILKKL